MVALHAVRRLSGAGFSKILLDITPEPGAPSIEVDRSLVGSLL